MKRISILFVTFLLSIALLSGCGAMAFAPVMGVLYTDVKAPLTATSNPSSTKLGKGSATSIFGLIATGDASIETACKTAGITKIHHVDYHATNILGIIATYTVYVYSE